MLWRKLDFFFLLFTYLGRVGNGTLIIDIDKYLVCFGSVVNCVRARLESVQNLCFRFGFVLFGVYEGPYAVLGLIRSCLWESDERNDGKQWIRSSAELTIYIVTVSGFD